MQRSIRVEMSTFKITVSEFGETVRTITNFSLGMRGHRTPTINGGTLHPTKRKRHHRSGRYPPPNGGARMPFSLFFTEDPDCAFHEGSPAEPSHGCIHLVQADAQWLFEWAGAHPVGLTIVGPYPASPVPPQRLYWFGAPNMRRDVVEAIQTALTAAGFDPDGVDGVFGDHTDDAVRAFQTANGLVIDGKVGRDTATQLGLDWAALTAVR